MQTGMRACRGMIRSREEGFLEEADDLQERTTQARHVRQRPNPEKVSELTSIRELLEDINEDTHEGTGLMVSYVLHSSSSR